MRHYYKIRVKGHLDHSWSDWLGGMTISHEENGATLLTGALPDQGALHGVLNRLGDLAVQLISVNRTDEDADEGKTNQA